MQPTLRLLYSDGRIISIDNTRLLAASRANIPVVANVHLPGDLLDETFALRFWDKKDTVPTNWGEAVEARIKKQAKSYRDVYSFGSYIIGAK